MEHQQNYSEYTGDPGSFGYMNSFPGSEYLIPHQGQPQMNGKSDADPALPMVPSSLPPLASMQSFDSGNSAQTQYMNQTPQISMYHLPQEPIAPTQTDEPQFTIIPVNNTPQFTSLPQDSASDFTSNARDFLAPAPTLDLNQQKDGLFSLSNPSIALSSDVSQVLEPIIPADDQSPQNVEPVATPNEPSTSIEGIPGDSLPIDESTKPLVFSPEQNSMMKALGVVRKDVLASVGGSKKRRRRILQLNEEDSDDENDLKKQLIESPEKDSEKIGADRSSPESESDEDLSKADPEALKARYLLKTAVMIKGPEDKKKKRKKRVLESDDEDEMQTSVDDIGLMGDSNENDADDDYLDNDIIISEPIIFDPEPEPETSTAEKSVDDANSETVHDFAIPETPAKPESDDKEVEKRPEETGKPENTAKEVAAGDVKTDDTSVIPAIVKKEKNVKEEPGRDDDLVNPIIKNEDGEIDPSMSVEAILDNIKPMADDEWVLRNFYSEVPKQSLSFIHSEFFKAGHKSDDSDCQFVSNEDYFGTPDLSKPMKWVQ